MGESVFDVVEHFLGDKITPKTLGKISKLGHAQIVELHDRAKFFYRANYWFVDREELPTFSKDAVRYAILTDRSGQMDSYEIWNNPDDLKKLLLYYPSVAVLDPVDELLSLAAEHPPVLEEVLLQLLPLRPLIEEDIIRLVPGVTGRSAVLDQIDLSGFLGHVLQDDKVIEAVRLYSPENYDMIVSMDLDLPGLMLTEREQAAIYPLARRQASLGLLTFCASVIKEVYTQFKMADLTDSNMALVSEQSAQFHTDLLGINLDVLPSLGKVDDYVASFMLSLALPDIQNISWADILAIRQNDEDFFYWREAFRQVMKDSYESGKISQRDFFKNAKEILSARSKLLRDSLQEKKSVKNKFLDAWIPAGIGFVGGMLTGSIEIAAAEAALTGALSLLYTLFAKRPTKSEEALYRHFAVLLGK